MSIQLPGRVADYDGVSNSGTATVLGNGSSPSHAPLPTPELPDAQQPEAAKAPSGRAELAGDQPTGRVGRILKSPVIPVMILGGCIVAAAVFQATAEVALVVLASVALAFWLAAIVVADRIGQHKQRIGWPWGLLLGGVGVVVLYLLPSRAPANGEPAPSAPTMRKAQVPASGSSAPPSEERVSSSRSESLIRRLEHQVQQVLQRDPRSDPHFHQYTYAGLLSAMSKAERDTAALLMAVRTVAAKWPESPVATLVSDRDARGAAGVTPGTQSGARAAEGQPLVEDPGGLLRQRLIVGEITVNDYREISSAIADAFLLDLDVKNAITASENGKSAD